MKERFTAEETERAIAILHRVMEDSGKPWVEPDVYSSLSDIEQAAARLRLIYPAIPKTPYRSNYARLWQSIEEGRYEGIRVADGLDYEKAYACGFPPRVSSYLERWMTYRIKNELGLALAEGWKGR